MSRASHRRHFWRTTSRTLMLCALALVTVSSVWGAATPLTLSAPATAAMLTLPTPQNDDALEEVQAESELFSMTVSPRVPVMKPADKDFTFTVSLTNDSDENLPQSLVSLAFSTVPLTAPSDLASHPEADTLTPVTPVETTPLPAGESRDITITITPEDFPLNAENPAGVYQVTAALEAPITSPFTAPEVALATAPAMPITWQGLRDDQTSPVTFVVPLVLPEHITVMPTPAQLADESPRLLDALEAAQSAQATVAVDPRIIAGIRAYGEAAPAAARNLLEALEASNQPQFLLQYSDADPTVQAALGATELLAPVGLSFVTRNGVFPHDPTTPSPKDSVGDSALEDPSTNNVPTLSELGTLDNAYPGAWPAPGEIDQAALTLLKQSNLTSLVISSANAPEARTPRLTTNDFTALVADDTLTDLSTQWINAANRTEQSRIAASLVAELTLAGQTNGPGVVIALDRAAASESPAIPDFITLVLSQPGIIPQPETDLATEPGTLRSAAPAEKRVEMLRAFTATSEQIADLAPLLATPTYLTEYQQLRLLNAFGTRYAAPETDLDAVSAKISARNTDLLQGVSAISTDTTHLVGASSNVPVTLHNHLPFEAAVTVRAAPGSAAIDVPTQQSTVITVPARGNAIHRVTVDSRVSSGESILHVEVLDRDRTQTFAQLNMQLTLRSSYEAVLLTGLGISAVTLFIAGIWRSVKRRRSSQQPAQSEQPH